MTSPRWAGLGVAAALSVLAACGTTAPQTSERTVTVGGQQQGGTNDLGVAATDPAGTPATATDGSVPTDAAATTDAGTSGGGTTGQAAPGGAAPTGSTTVTKSSAPTKAGTTSASKGSAKTTATGTTGKAATIPATGQGWDAKYIYIGLGTQNDVSGVATAAGLKLDPGSPPADAQAVIDDINKKGGIYGRQLKLVQHDNSTVAAQGDPNSVGQQDCAAFTQDNHVIGVINPVTLIDVATYRKCLANAKTPLISVSVAPLDDQTFSGLAPYFYSSLIVSLDKMIPVFITRLKGEGYFSGWSTAVGGPGTAKVKVGVIYNSTVAEETRGQATLVNQLKAAGYDAISQGYQSNSDMSGVVVNFESASVTHVIEIDSTLGAFTQAAESQHFRPRYGLSTLNGIEPILLDNDQQAQLVGAVGIGWFPTLDVEKAQDPGPVGPGYTECVRELTAAKISFTSRFSEAVGVALCDGIQLLAKGAASGGGLDPASIRKGIVAAAPGFQQASSFASGLSATSFALPGGARDLGFDSSCNCVSYKGPTYSIG